MFDALSFAEIDGQHAELLPGRTVLSLFSTGGGGTASAAQCNTSGSGLVNVMALNNVAQGLLNILGTGCSGSASVS